MKSTPSSISSSSSKSYSGTVDATSEEPFVIDDVQPKKKKSKRTSNIVYPLVDTNSVVYRDASDIINIFQYSESPGYELYMFDSADKSPLPLVLFMGCLPNEKYVAYLCNFYPFEKTFVTDPQC